MRDSLICSFINLETVGPKQEIFGKYMYTRVKAVRRKK